MTAKGGRRKSSVSRLKLRSLVSCVMYLVPDFLVTRHPSLVTLLAVALACVLAAGEAPAKGSGGRSGSGHSSGKSNPHHGKHHHHHTTGSTVFYGSYWPFWPGMAYALAPIYEPAPPIYYIEKSEEELRSDTTWFYCEGEATYYPYVKQCPGGWVKVAPF
jgi:hypothetical protein